LIARAPGPPTPVLIDQGRIAWLDDADRKQVHRIDTLRATGRRRAVYRPSLDTFGRDPYAPKPAGRWPTTVMATDDVFGDGSLVLRVPKVRGLDAHRCAKPLALLVQLVELLVPRGGVVLDPFAGSGTIGEAARITGRRAVLVDLPDAA
jgi:hypothetical protein